MRPIAAVRGRAVVPRVAGNGLLNNLIGYWGLDEAGGANDALDKHNGARTLTQTGSPGSAAGKVYAGARTFDGASDYFSRAHETALQVGDNDVTWAAWVYLDTVSANQSIIGRWYSGGSSREYLVFYNYNDSGPGNCFTIAVNPTGSGTTERAFATNHGAASTGTWYLVIAWHDAINNQIAISVNDGTPNTQSYSSGVYAGTSDLGVGVRLTGSVVVLLAGRLGPIAMWKSTAGNGGVLTSDQRTALYNSGAGLPYASFTT